MSTATTFKPEAPRLQEQDLAGKVAVVTGATRSIGRAIALNLATRGASIIGTYSAPSSAHLFDVLEHTVASLYANSPSTTSKPKLVGVAANLLDPDCASIITAALSQHFGGKLDILVNNAAVTERVLVGEWTAEPVQRLLLANIQTPVLVLDALVRGDMFRPQSRVVNISSDRARDARPGGSVFAATKSALESLTRVWADELGKRPSTAGTTVNAVAVGLTNSHQFRQLPARLQQALMDERLPKVSVGPRVAECEDVADVVGFLVSEKARWVSGSVVCANGGAAKIL